MTEKQQDKRPRTSGEGRLPGNPIREELIARMIRVNHAGEYGAVRICQGQLAVLDGTPEADVIRTMADKELEHLQNFGRLIAERRVRPTLLTPLWHMAGFALGAASAALDPRAAMACTQAVEEVIDEHYAGQTTQLGDDETELREMIEQYRADEIEHRDTALAHDAKGAPAYELLTGAVKAGSKLAIWLSTRI